jgi:hypothetical protein
MLGIPFLMVLIIFNLASEIYTSLMPSYNALAFKLAEVIIYGFCQLLITASILWTIAVQRSDVRWIQNSSTSEAKGDHPADTDEDKETDMNGADLAGNIAGGAIALGRALAK